jgi:23S rRNA (uracil-5-)-methyltransferase RumA
MKQQNICNHFGLCGGCESQNLDYNIQLSQKQNYIKEKFKDFAVEQYCDIIPSPQVWYYRNKMEFVVGKEKTGEIVSGLRQKGKFYKIINLKECKISFENTLEILDMLRNWVKESSIEPYDLVSHKGKVRYLVVKESKTNNKILLNLIVTGTKYQVENNEYDLYRSFVERYKKLNYVSSIYLSINNKLSDNAVAEEILHLYGEKYIVEEINGVLYKIYPQTFLQTNTKCCELLYKTVLDEVEEGNILDIYCGSGGIALQIVKHKLSIDKIIGIDSSQENINTAIENCELNNCNKDIIEFVCSTAEEFVQKLWKSKFLTNLSTIVVDPPRPGLSKRVKSILLDLSVNKIIYISCNPNTLYEDLKILLKFYKIKKIVPIDMFPHTPHIEVVCVLEHK